jgi:succinate dehydrogenase/fumarate reductase flavoprotein subunit
MTVDEAIARREKRDKRELIPTRVSSLSNAKEGVNGEFFTVKNAFKFRNEIQELMRDNAGIVREDKKLQKGLKRLLALKKEFYSKDNVVKKNLRLTIILLELWNIELSFGCM